MISLNANEKLFHVLVCSWIGKEVIFYFSFKISSSSIQQISLLIDFFFNLYPIS